jgi:hypothetical protein
MNNASSESNTRMQQLM